MRINKLHHIALICSNYDLSRKFYTKVIGLEIINEVWRDDRQSWKLDLALNGEYLIELFSFPSPPDRVSGPEAAGARHIAFEVPDLDKAVDELTAQHVPVESIRIDPVTKRRFTFFKDPDGLPLELYEA